MRRPPVFICLLLMATVLLSEATAWIFLALPPAEGKGPVYTWVAGKGAVPVEDRNTVMAREQYHADRGGQWSLTALGGIPVTLYYFEWDKLETAPTMVLDGHHAELCNEAAGFRLLERLPPRQITGPGGERVEFDVTRFSDPSGRIVYSFKNVWLSNTGNWDLRSKSRWLRLRLPFIRRQDAARVLQAGVFTSGNPDDAWGIFQGEVLSYLIWGKENTVKQ